MAAGGVRHVLWDFAHLSLSANIPTAAQRQSDHLATFLPIRARMTDPVYSIYNAFLDYLEKIYQTA